MKLHRPQHATRARRLAVAVLALTIAFAVPSSAKAEDGTANAERGREAVAPGAPGFAGATLASGSAAAQARELLPAAAGRSSDVTRRSRGDQPKAVPQVLPALAGWQAADGQFELGRHSRVVANSARGEAATFVEDAREVVGRRLNVVQGKAKAGDIVLAVDAKRSELGAEGYELSVGKTIAITAKTDAGVFYGTRTVLQLLKHGQVPAGRVVDVPAYAERGVGVCACLINVSTAWFERLVKDAAYLKLNQLWVELKVKSDVHPESVEWGYYTKPQIAALQRLADKYHVTIVPEVNSPGHIEPWIRNRPDLQLTDNTGAKQVSRLDITKPEAFDFLTAIIDENLRTFRTPYWHMGADEYMLGSDYAKYPQLLEYARAKFGPDAVPQDAFVDFINRVNAHVKAQGKTLRIWNDGITDAATVPLDRDIVVEHWLSGGVKPSKLIAEGRQVMNSAYALYNVRGGFKTNAQQLYDSNWTPLRFEGETLAGSNGVTGAKISLWPDNGSGNTENEIEAEVRMPLRLVAQATWSTVKPDPTYAAFTARADAVGRAPGFDNVDRTPVAAGTYSLSTGRDYLGVAATEGAQLKLESAESAWDVTPTTDGYYTLTSLATGRCAESRVGVRYLNTPLQPGTPITAQTCDSTNRLQRWQLARSGSQVTLVNAITRMVAVVDRSGGLIQQIPDGHQATPLTLKPVLRAVASVDRQTVVSGSTAQLKVTVTAKDRATDVTVRPTVPAGWSVTPASRTTQELAAGSSFTATFTATPPADAPAGTAALGATTSYQQGGVTHRLSTTAGVRLSCVPAATSPVAVKYVDSEETAGEDGRAVNAIDGNPATFWHTEWSARQPQPPHEIQLDLGSAKSVCAVTYLTRQNATNGRIADYEIYLSTDGVSWGQPASKGTFGNSPDAKWVPVAATTARYVRLVQLSEASGNPFGTAAEITVDAK
ncbi:glycoside hydrolase family 20 zincin-like fold domain-containing protein [Kribbella lupini]|uniref:Family 20 glycosylhydrolase n=1 Tax=Kribbella lupini TaxID=291602 RepID=A0ABP4MWY4_9ACTN